MRLAKNAARPYLYTPQIMANPAFVVLDGSGVIEGRGVLAVSGPDRRLFLQGLVSNDVEQVDATQARYAALLTAQGKYLHDFMMVGRDGSILLDAEASRLADLTRRLSIYRLRAKVTLAAEPALAVAAVFGAGALAALGLPDEPGAARRFGAGIAFVDPRLAALGARCILPRETMRAALAESGIAEADFADYDRLRLGLGVPDGSRDLIVEKSILLESGFDELHGVDWHKGCYMGQELTARTKYRGLVRKRLLPVDIAGPAPAPGTVVVADGREAGEMRSSCGARGLALLRIEPVRENRRLVAGDAVLLPRPPDWLRLETDAG
ncbi:MAG: YgfZ/GcvT domain-containing protein [Stellaceae bacterium]